MTIIQWASVAFTVGLLILSILRLRLRPNRRLLRIPVLFFGFHVLVFYAYVAFNRMGALQESFFFHSFTSGEWSSILRLHSLLTYFLLEFYGWERDKEWKHRR
jgi:hypothetical protein